MKLKYILIISIGVNAALAVAYVKKSPPAVEAHQEKAAVEAKSAAVPVDGGEKATVLATTNSLVQKFNWETVESEDYRKYIANLRAIGCPEETIRDIIIADVNKLFESRRKEFKPKKEFKYWQTGMQMFAGMMDEEKIKKQQELAREKRALLKELLGIEPEEKMDMAAMFGGANPFEEMLGFLSPSKQTQVMELEQKYAAKQMKAFQNGAPDAEDMKEMAKMQKEKDAELAQLLSPQEKEDYELRMSQTAMMMRMQLGSFDPNEQEFRDIFKLKKQYDDEFGGAFGMMNSDKTEREKMNTAQKELNEKIKGMLGENRYADYERAQDFAFQGIYRVTERQGLPKDSAIKIYDMKKAADEAKTKIRSDSSLSKEDRDLRLKQVDTETDAAMKVVWGEKGAEAYKKSRNGFMGFNPN